MTTGRQPKRRVISRGLLLAAIAAIALFLARQRQRDERSESYSRAPIRSTGRTSTDEASGVDHPNEARCSSARTSSPSGDSEPFASHNPATRWDGRKLLAVIVVTVVYVVWVFMSETSLGLPRWRPEGWVLACGSLFVIGLGLVAVAIRLGERRRSTTTVTVLTDAGIALATGAVIGLVIFGSTIDLEDRLVAVQERHENVRFVRSLATQQPELVEKPLSGLDLRGASLTGLDLSRARLDGARLSDADLQDADLACADLRLADLRSAHLGGATLAGATLRSADLRDANSGTFYLGVDQGRATMTTRGVDLRGAHLEGSQLTGIDHMVADLRGANLAGASLDDDFDFSGLLYDESTVWPAGIDPPPFDERLVEQAEELEASNPLAAPPTDCPSWGTID